MRKITFAVFAAGALIPAVIAGWASTSNRPAQAKSPAAIGVQIDTFSMMVNAKDLPVEAFQDFSLVFPSPAIREQTSVRP